MASSVWGGSRCGARWKYKQGFKKCTTEHFKKLVTSVCCVGVLRLPHLCWSMTVPVISIIQINLILKRSNVFLSSDWYMVQREQVCHCWLLSSKWAYKGSQVKCGFLHVLCMIYMLSVCVFTSVSSLHLFHRLHLWSLQLFQTKPGRWEGRCQNLRKLQRGCNDHGNFTYYILQPSQIARQ